MQQDNSVNAMYIATNGSMNGLNITTTCETSGSGVGYTQTTTSGTTNALYYNGTGWDYWQNYYYPQVIRESYPVYIKERAEDKGKHAFEIIKMLQDKRFIKFEKVSDFIDAMDALIKVL